MFISRTACVKVAEFHRKAHPSRKDTLKERFAEYGLKPHHMVSSQNKNSTIQFQQYSANLSLKELSFHRRRWDCGLGCELGGRAGEKDPGWSTTITTSTTIIITTVLLLLLLLIILLLLLLMIIIIIMIIPLLLPLILLIIMIIQMIILIRGQGISRARIFTFGCAIVLGVLRGFVKTIIVPLQNDQRILWRFAGTTNPFTDIFHSFPDPPTTPSNHCIIQFVRTAPQSFLTALHTTQAFTAPFQTKQIVWSNTDAYVFFYWTAKHVVLVMSWMRPWTSEPWGISSWHWQSLICLIVYMFGSLMIIQIYWKCFAYFLDGFKSKYTNYVLARIIPLAEKSPNDALA